nr:hypothetical protein [Tanacetum cinerariifolium]GEW51567.1 hypothetical protein [Tanacetum cinerariifolium]
MDLVVAAVVVALVAVVVLEVETMVVFIDGDEAATRVAVAAEEWGRRAVESGVVDHVDLEEGDVFGVRRKRSPKKFSVGGGGDRRRPACGRR